MFNPEAIINEVSQGNPVHFTAEKKNYSLTKDQYGYYGLEIQKRGGRWYTLDTGLPKEDILDHLTAIQKKALRNEDKGIPEAEYMDAIRKAGSEAILECIPNANLADFNFSKMYDAFYDTMGSEIDREDYDSELEYDEAKMDRFKDEIRNYLDDYLVAGRAEEKYRAEAKLFHASEAPNYTAFTDKDGQNHRLHREDNGEFTLGSYDPDYTEGTHTDNSDWVYINIGNYDEALRYLKDTLGFGEGGQGKEFTNDKKIDEIKEVLWNSAWPEELKNLDNKEQEGIVAEAAEMVLKSLDNDISDDNLLHEKCESTLNAMAEAKETRETTEETRDYLKMAMEAAGYHYDDINSDSYLCFHDEYGGSDRFPDWHEVKDWLNGVVFDDPDVSDKVEKIMKSGTLTDYINDLVDNGATIITNNSIAEFNENKFTASVSDNGDVVVVELDAMGRGSTHKFDAGSIRVIRDKLTTDAVYRKNEPQGIMPDRTVNTDHTH